ncbi:MAG: hypothetical protein NTV43_10115 [Methylococcales bacterium]|nr:hypothetical protein [Methylococcales bacterium]
MTNKPGLVGLFCVILLKSSSATADLDFQVGSAAITKDTPRLGVNLGEWAAWGSSQFPRNILKNPGFEGIIDRAIVIVKAADARGFSDDTEWTKRPDGFWAGAQFDVRTGPDAGKQGELFDSLATGKLGLPEFKSKGQAPQLLPGDVVSLTLSNDQGLPSHWWLSKGLLPGQVAVVMNDHRPQGLGARTLALNPLAGKPVTVSSYLDAIPERAGKLLPVNGSWTIRFWMRQKQAGANLSVSFRRLNGSAAFFQETFQASSQWQLFERHFTAQDHGKPGILELSLQAVGTGGGIILDDIELAADTGNSPFRTELIAALKQLQPGYLRDWQGQLADTYSNRIADVFARRASRYRPGEDSTFSYGLPEFLQLAKTVGAQPWVIIPPTMGDQELQQLGGYLSQQITALGLQDLLLEFGNENWNSVFRPAGIPDSRAHGLVATRAFGQLLQGAKHHPALKTVINGQYVNPQSAEKFLGGVSNASALAVAPYFLFQLDAHDNVLDALFEQDDFYQDNLKVARSLGKELMVYEVNLHTTTGDAPLAARDIATTSSAAGAALAKRLLTAINLGIKRQCVYTLSQFDAFTESASPALVKLWGISRDLGDTQRLRPTGLAVAMLNQALPADIYPIPNQADKAITLSALHNAKGWGLAAVSAKSYPHKISVHFPTPLKNQSWRLLRLDSPLPTDNNEVVENVRITEEALSPENDSISLTIPAYGFVIALAGK